MAGWIVTITAIALLSVLCDVILPDGTTKKYAKTVFGVAVTMVIVQSAANVWKNYATTDLRLNSQQTYVENVLQRSESQKSRQLVVALRYKGYQASVEKVGELICVEVSGDIDEEVRAEIRRMAQGVFGNEKAVSVTSTSDVEREK